MVSEIKSNYKEILIVFFATLLSIYFPSLGNLRIFDFVSFVLILYVLTKDKESINKDILPFFLFFTLFITFSIIISIINQAEIIYIPRILGSYFTVAYSILFYSYFVNRIDRLAIALKYTIYIHAIFFYIQYISFHLAGIYIDFVKMITGNDSRNIGGIFNLNTSIRASGLYSEPATYSLFILSLMSAFILYKRRMNYIDCIILMSIILSASASGIIYLSVFIVVYFILYSNLSWLKKTVISISFASVLLFFNLTFIESDYLYNKIYNFEKSGSFQYRIGNISKDVDSLPFFKQLFGIGYANLDASVDKGSTFSSLFIEHGYILGGFFLLILLVFLIKNHVRWYILAYIALLFMGTHTFAQIQFWIWILSIAIISNYIYYDRQDL